MTDSSAKCRRVVITGIGVICPLGSHPEELWNGLSTGTSGVVTCDMLPVKSAGLSLKYAGECRQFSGDIDNFGDLEKGKKKSIRKALKMMCRETQMAVAAAELALFDAKVADGSLDPERSGVVLGSDYMLTMPEDYIDSINKCTEEGKFDYEDWGTDGLGQMTPLWMLKYLPNMPASHIAILNDLRGPNNSLTLREASSNMAVGEAFTTVARGHADFMLAGATGTRILPMQAIHAMQTEQLADADCDPAAACRPFDKNRIGMVAGEGSGVVVLEELEHAQARGAKIYGEVTGIGSSLVADRNLVGDTEKAMANAITACLRDAELAPSDLGHLNAHGLATTEGDRKEAAAIGTALGDAGKNIPVTALKSYFGNLGAASGVVELAGSLLAMQHGQLPAVLNYTEADPECDLTIATSGAQPGSSFLNLSVTPQGQASVLAVVAS
ncbi:beta-ketoacyl-[acyl-carrier-protein] synthase family protein [Aeoliella sp.]|uniref:beta-ketoacyl-[acyl-carrier-protein] synthase family protein n=1 Tax=Aeoliella sp. TaxID=2795800 RepID=UPI003CCBD2C9